MGEPTPSASGSEQDLRRPFAPHCLRQPGCTGATDFNGDGKRTTKKDHIVFEYEK